MFDMSWGEVMVIGAVALIVIGPKDLPRALRTVGNMVGKVRRLAGEFQGQFNEAMREAELDDVKRQIQGVNDSVSSLGTGFNPVQTIRDELKGAIDSKPAEYKPAEPVASASPGYTSPAPDTPDSDNPASLPADSAAALSLPPLPEIPSPAESFAPAAEPSSRVVVADIPSPEPAPVRQDEKA
ncbi:MAG TPA: Sec-independent protein translocase protein TatB [Microvirga sp.]|jgi:sec-independent protein translocase protein TatB|nr:Sec-independent protein translocase protein TatB [Microvirga sp.]